MPGQFFTSPGRQGHLSYSVLPAPLLAPSCLLVLLHPHPIAVPIPTCSRSALRSFMWMFLGAAPQFEKSYISGFQTGGTEGS